MQHLDWPLHGQSYEQEFREMVASAMSTVVGNLEAAEAVPMVAAQSVVAAATAKETEMVEMGLAEVQQECEVQVEG